MADIGELCENKSILLEKVNARPNDTDFRQKMALKTCNEHIGLDCNFEVPDLKEIVLVCDCHRADQTWDADAKECRLYAGRKQFCTDDSQCVTGAACKNEVSKLRDYARWEDAVYKFHNLTKPRAASHTIYGKIQEISVDDARRRRKRILSRVVRHSYKEEVGECTCIRKELKFEYINKLDPCIARKHPPPLRLAHASQIRPLGFMIILTGPSIINNLQTYAL
ncbi:unnamed protein product [Allacma fusca]|uniref:Uncharacterized protein n=1 Tax=Allacma fusca TaxID=39272 RepID=A0A8J2KX16_9HEXA|nr:unnamed protein product [Allacma fusca]